MPAIGNIEIILFANTTGFAKSLKDASFTAKAFGATFSTSIGKELAAGGRILAATAKSVFSLRTALVAAGAAFAAWKGLESLHQASEMVDALGKSAKRIGMTAEQLSALRYAAGQSGIEFETLSTMAGKAAKNIAEIVADGKREMQIGRLKVRLTDAAGQVRNIAELLPDLAKGIESAGSEAEQLRLSEKIFGRAGGAQFVTFLKESGTFLEGMAQQTERAGRLGAIFTADQVKKLTAYNDALSDVGKAWEGLKVKLMTEIAPPLTKFLDEFALKLASIPQSIQAFKNASMAASGSGQDASRAGAALDKAFEKSWNLFLVTAKSAGDLFITTVVEGMKIAGRTLVLVAASTLRGSYPWLAKQLGDPSFQAEAQYNELVGIRENLAKAQERLLREYPNGVPKGGSPLQQQIVQRLMQDGAPNAKTIEEAFADIDKRIEQFRNQLENDKGVTEQQMARFAKEAGEAIAATAEKRAAEIKAAYQEAGAAIDAVITSYTPMGPPAPEGSPEEAAKKYFPNPMNALDGLVAKAKAVGAKMSTSISEGMKELWPKIKEQLAEQQKWADTLRASDDQVFFKLYPEKQAEEMVARARAMREEMKRLGMEVRATDAEFEAWGKELVKAATKVEDLRNTAKDTFARSIQDEVFNMAGDVGQAFADMTIDGKRSFADLAKSWGKTLVAMASQTLLFKPIFDLLGNSIGPWLGGTRVGQTSTVPGSVGGARAEGGPVDAGKWYMVGENGPELMRAGGDGYVFPHGAAIGMGGGRPVTVNVYNEVGGQVQTSERQGPSGERVIDVYLRKALVRALGDGSVDTPLRQNFGITRRGTPR